MMYMAEQHHDDDRSRAGSRRITTGSNRKSSDEERRPFLGADESTRSFPVKRLFVEEAETKFDE